MCERSGSSPKVVDIISSPGMPTFWRGKVNVSQPARNDGLERKTESSQVLEGRRVVPRRTLREVVDLLTNAFHEGNQGPHATQAPVLITELVSECEVVKLVGSAASPLPDVIQGWAVRVVRRQSSRHITAADPARVTVPLPHSLVCCGPVTLVKRLPHSLRTLANRKDSPTARNPRGGAKAHRKECHG